LSESSAAKWIRLFLALRGKNSIAKSPTALTLLCLVGTFRFWNVRSGLWSNFLNSPKRFLARQQIQSQFDRAARTYDSVASLQRRMGDVLLREIVDSDTPKEARLIDLGCGTGELLRQLELGGYSNLAGLDLSSKMIEAAREKASTAKFHHASIEELLFEENVFDIAISNAAIQWCDAETAASEILRVLKPGGKILINVFTAGTLQQWHDAFIAGGFESRVHPLAGAEQIENAFADAGFEAMKTHRQKETTQFDSVKKMFDSIRQLGATNAMSSRARNMSRGEYMWIKNHFQTELDANGKLELDFQWVQIEAEKKLGSS